MKKSKALFARAQRVLVGGVNSPVRAFRAVGGTPVFVGSGRGSRLVDADGKSYIDYCLSWGPLILGHAHPGVTRAASRAAARGASFGAPTEGEILLAEEIRRAYPSMERVRLTSSGTEAVMSALRAARAWTKRDWVVKFQGCYHGHADSLLVAAGSGALTLGRPDSAGVPAAWAKTTLVLPYNDVAAVEAAFKRHGSKIAALIVEPVVGNMGTVLPEPGFLEALRRITKRHRALLVFDEVITGFRLGLGGAQAKYRITPDLTSLGKIVGGGFPIGAYGGRREIMEQIAPLGPVYQAGTLSGNPVAVAAGLECVRTLRRTAPYGKLEALTRRLARGLQEAADAAGVPARVQTTGSMFTLFFTPHLVRDYPTAKTADTKRYARFFHAMLAEGVYLPPAQFEAAFLSAAHTPADVERTIAAARRAFKRC
ncbi:MAG: glutamate-1-semialdehyde 2,1-aminomutase [Elusimicrobia bacterium]|nr:glutamate-1-semialdehyde 2,1-aminomutase [Elusimicrobiota bacterium]